MATKLAGAFPPQTADAWQEAARATQFDPDKKRSADGVVLDPVYFGVPPGLVDERPGVFPNRRGDKAAPSPWAVRQPFSDANLDATNLAILKDLERGVTEVLVELDASTSAGLDPDSHEGAPQAGQNGLPLASVDDWDLILAGVYEDLAPIALKGGVASIPQAALLIGLWKRRGRDLSTIRGSLGAGPLSAWAKLGHLPGGPDQALADVVALARWCGENAPLVHAVRADEGPFHDAGASDAQGLGLLLAEAVAYLKAFAGAGHDLALGSRQMELSVYLGADVFAGIAKLRAVRLLWSRVLEVLEVPGTARPRIVARIGRPALTRFDPWVNILRGTAATFAAAVGGAEAITIEPFDAALGLPDQTGRRLARNTQLILQDESHLFRVADPAGGSYYLEHRSEAVAEAAWSVFTAIEGQGGLVTALQNGDVHERIRASREDRQLAVDRRKRPLTGVSEFPDPGEPPVERATPDSAWVSQKAGERLALCRTRLPAWDVPAEALAKRPVAASVEAAAAGATLGLIQAKLIGRASAAGERATISPLPQVRLAEGFESLRAAVQSTAAPPIYLANLGPMARHTARATFMQNLVGVAGFRVEHGPPTEDPSETAARFRDSGARVAVLCGADDDYARLGTAFAQALTEAGAHRVLLAGRFGDLEPPLKAAGVSGHFALGMNVREALEGLLADHDIDAAPQGAKL